MAYFRLRVRRKQVLASRVLNRERCSHVPYDQMKREPEKKAKNHQRLRARKASVSSSQIMTETDSAQEAEETDGPGKCGNSTEHSHGLN